MSLCSVRRFSWTSKRLCRQFSALYNQAKHNKLSQSHKIDDSCSKCSVTRSFQTSKACQDLMDFFATKEEMIESDVKTGRPWNMGELRLKSNEDLHKLWYILLKERNMLFTMKKMYKSEGMAFPNPERVWKVEESMRNVMEVIKEREKAINLLETGETGEPKVRKVMNYLGMTVEEEEKEHLVPSCLNEQYKLTHPKYEKWMEKYLRLYNEKKLEKAEKDEEEKTKYLNKLKEKFPHLTEEDLDFAWEQEQEEMKKMGSYTETAKQSY